MDNNKGFDLAFYFNTVTKEFPRFIGDLKLLGWVDGDSLPENWVEVYKADIPIVSELEIYDLIEPIKIEGYWFANYQIRLKTENEIILEIEIQKLIDKRFNNA